MVVNQSCVAILKQVACEVKQIRQANVIILMEVKGHEGEANSR